MVHFIKECSKILILITSIRMRRLFSDHFCQFTIRFSPLFSLHFLAAVIWLNVADMAYNTKQPIVC